MRKVISLVAVVVTLSPVTALANWDSVRWGMQPDQVVAAGDGEIKAVKDKPSERINNDQKLAVGKAVITGISYKLAYYFRIPTNELVMIQFEPDRKNCEAAVASYNSRFGEAKPEHLSRTAAPVRGQIILTRYQWRDTNRSDLIKSTVGSAVGVGTIQCYFLHMKLEP